MTWTPVRDSTVLAAYSIPLAPIETPLGERLYTASSNVLAPLIGVSIAATISLTNTSEAATTGNNVVIAEQVEYTIALTIPPSTVPSLSVKDLIPSGLALASLPAVSYGAAITAAQPSITPAAATLPMTSSGVAQWNFGSGLVVATSGNVADRQVTIKFVTQVQNVASLVSGSTLSTNASFTYNGVDMSIPVLGGGGATVITLSVVEPSLSLTMTQVTPNQLVQAGDVIRYLVKVDNAPAALTTFDLELDLTLSPYVVFSSGSARMSVGGSGYNAGASVAVSDPDVVGSNLLVWGRGQAAYNPASSLFASISPGVPFYMIFDVIVGQTVTPSQVMIFIIYPNHDDFLLCSDQKYSLFSLGIGTTIPEPHLDSSPQR